ncbi:11796_t:CDS:2, partial [Funneliformis geosporum]
MEPTSDLVVGARCDIQGKFGTIRFVGPTTFDTGKWVGVELDDPLGKNSGSQAGKHYFDCRQNHGVFVRPSQIKIIDLINSPQSQQYNVEHPHNHADGSDIKETKQPMLKHPLEFLFGTWYGEGNGKFEGISDFVYNEEITINPDEADRGWLYYRQKTWNPMKNNSNFHSEMGYIRVPGMGNKVELVLAQPTGIASIEEGRID